MTESTIVRIEPDLSKISSEFAALVAKCYQEKPDKKDLRELQKRLDQSPELWLYVFDLTDVIRGQIIKDLITQPAGVKGLEANMQAIKNGLGYDQSPMVERLLIDSVITSWLRWQWAELRYAQHMTGQHSMSEGEYWLQTMGSAQRRYLNAVETLARVRRITRATMQINIAEPGSQQVNIAGDLNRV